MLVTQLCPTLWVPLSKLCEDYFDSSSPSFLGCSSEQRINIPGFINSHQSSIFVTLHPYSLQAQLFGLLQGTPRGKTASLPWILTFSEILASVTIILLSLYLTKLFRRFYFHISSNIFGCLCWPRLAYLVLLGVTGSLTVSLLKNSQKGTSLMVQWLRIHLVMHGTGGLQIKIPRAMEQLSLSCKYWARVLCSLCATLRPDGAK